MNVHTNCICRSQKLETSLCISRWINRGENLWHGYKGHTTPPAAVWQHTRCWPPGKPMRVPARRVPTGKSSHRQLRLGMDRSPRLQEGKQVYSLYYAVCINSSGRVSLSSVQGKFNMRIETFFPGATVVKNPPTNAGDAGNMSSIPGSGRFPGEGNCNVLQYSCLENSMDRGAWWSTVSGVAKNQTWLSAHR